MNTSLLQLISAIFNLMAVALDIGLLVLLYRWYGIK